MKKLKEVEQKPRKKRGKKYKNKKTVIILFDPNKIIINWDYIIISKYIIMNNHDYIDDIEDPNMSWYLPEIKSQMISMMSL